MATNNPPPPPGSEAFRGYVPQTPRPGWSGQEGRFPGSYSPSGEATAYNPQPSPSGYQPPYEPYQPSPSGQRPSEPYRQSPYSQQHQYRRSSFAGQRQPPYGRPFAEQAEAVVGPDERTSRGMKVRIAALLSCLFGWVGGLIFLLLERENRYVRFYAMQSLLFFGGMSMVQAIIIALPWLVGPFSAILGLITFSVWVVLLYMTYHGRSYKLPVIGEYAERLLNGGMFR